MTGHFTSYENRTDHELATADYAPFDSHPQPRQHSLLTEGSPTDGAERPRDRIDRRRGNP